jgi:hypothetical protein
MSNNTSTEIDSEAWMPADEYRKNAQECVQQAQKATNDKARNAWLGLGEHWTRLAKELQVAQPQRQSGEAGAHYERLPPR